LAGRGFGASPKGAQGKRTHYPRFPLAICISAHSIDSLAIVEVTAHTGRITGARLALVLLLTWACGLRLWLAVPGLDEGRFWDERYGVENLCSLLVDGQLRPANGFHPGLSYLPHAAALAASEGLHRLTGRTVFAVLAGDDDLSPTGYFLCRLLQALAGTLSLYLTYRIGRRLYSPSVGFTGALLLAVVPWHLRQSVIFKPDILLLTTTLLAFAASLSAAERPTRRGFAVAGAALGLALASKFNAAPAAIPVVVAALAGGGWRSRQRWGALLLAFAVAVAVCLLFTPYLALDPGLYAWSFGMTLRDYAAKGAKTGGSHLMVLATAPRALLSQPFHGPVVGALGLAGLVLSPIGAALRGGSPPGLPAGKPAESRARRLGPLMMSAYVAGYALAYALCSTNASSHNWLPVTPFVAVAAAWTLLGSWEWIAPRLGARQRLALGAAALAAAALWLVAPANAYVYEACVPPTQELARDYLRHRLWPLGWRVVVREEDSDAQWYNEPAIVQEVKVLDEMAPEDLDRADAEIFPADRLHGPRGGYYRRRLAAPGADVARFEPRPFRARGRAVIVVVHRWIEQGKPEPLALSPRGPALRRLAADLPIGAGPPAVASLEVSLPRRAEPEALVDVLIRGKPLAPVFVRRESGSPRFLTERFLLPAAASRVILVLAQPFPPYSGVGIQLQRWRPPGSSRPASPATPAAHRVSGDRREPLRGVPLAGADAYEPKKNWNGMWARIAQDCSSWRARGKAR